MQTKIEKISPYSALAIKNIQECEHQDLDFLSFREKLSLANISHPAKKKEWKGARLAIKSALDAIKLPYPGFFKDEHGKSHPMDQSGFVSLTHTRGIAAAIYNEHMPVGIDLELIRGKVVRLGPKFLKPEELDFLGNDPLLMTIAWSAKESIYKCHGKKGISLRQHIFLSPFTVDDKIIQGKIHGLGETDHQYLVQVKVENDIILTFTIW